MASQTSQASQAKLCLKISRSFASSSPLNLVGDHDLIARPHCTAPHRTAPPRARTKEKAKFAEVRRATCEWVSAENAEYDGRDKEWDG